MSRRELRKQSKLDELIAVCRSGNTKKASTILKHETHIETLLDVRNKAGTTALHEACCFGRTGCVELLLRSGACTNIWDLRGFSPIHCAVYNNHFDAVDVLLKWTPRISSNPRCDVDQRSSYSETPLHIACMRGHSQMAQFLVESGADPHRVDRDGNTCLHFACGGDSAELLHWLLGQLELASRKDETNQYGQSPAHRATLLGCVSTVGVLVHYKADTTTLLDRAGHSPPDLARILNNTECFRLASLELAPSPLPQLPSTIPQIGSRGSLSRSSMLSTESLLPPDDQRRGSGLLLGDEQRRGSGLLFQTQHSHTSGDSQSSPSSLKRNGSITGRHRPRNIQLPSSLPEVGGASSGGVGGASSEPLFYASKAASDQVKRGIRRQNSRSKGDMYKLLYDTTAYEPPQEIMFVQPHHSDTLTLERRATFSLEHDLKLSVSKSYWRENKLKQPQLDVCLTAAMHFNRSFPPGFVIVSPICFVSLKSQHHPSITFTVPHALRSSEKERNRICILFMHTVDPNLSIDSPIGLPTERTLSCLRDDVIKEIGPNFVSFGTQLVCPTLFAVGMRTDEKIPAPLALKCSLFVTYPILDGNTTISAFEVVVYIGMSLKTVETVVAAQTSNKRERFNKFNFTLESEDLEVQADLKNKPEHWTIDALTQGKIKFSQIALSRGAHESVSYSHDFAYPPLERFFIEPQSAVGAVKCLVSLAGSRGFSFSQLVIPYRGASKEPTPEPTPPSSQPVSQASSLTGLHVPLIHVHVPHIYINGTTSQSTV